MSRPVIEPNVWRGTFAIRSAIVRRRGDRDQDGDQHGDGDPWPRHIPVHPHECDRGGAEARGDDRCGRRPVAAGEPHQQPHPGQCGDRGEKGVRRAGGAARRNRRGGQCRGHERGPRRAFGDDAARADPCADRDCPEQADRRRRRTGWAPAVRFRGPSAAATAACRPRRAHRRRSPPRPRERSSPKPARSARRRTAPAPSRRSPPRARSVRPCPAGTSASTSPSAML